MGMTKNTDGEAKEQANLLAASSKPCFTDLRAWWWDLYQHYQARQRDQQRDYYYKAQNHYDDWINCLKLVFVASDSTISLKGGQNAKFCADENDKVICDRTAVGTWEK